MAPPVTVALVDIKVAFAVAVVAALLPSVSAPAVNKPASASIVSVFAASAPFAVTVLEPLPISRVASAAFATVLPNVPVRALAFISASSEVTVIPPAPVSVNALPSTIPSAVTVKVFDVTRETEFVPCPKITVEPSEPVTLKPSV